MADHRQPAETIAAALSARGCRVAFGVPGGGPNLDLVGALERAGMRFVLAHSETSAAIMASVHGYVSGVTSPVVVTRGPGATAVANGVAQATLDRHPLLAITDTVPEASADRVAHQRLDQGALMTPITKHSGRVGPAATTADLDALVDLAERAPAGAVHIDYDATTDDPPTPPAPRSAVSVANTVDDDGAARALLANARRPVAIVGNLFDSDPEPVRQQLIRFGAPVLSTYHGMGTIPSEHPLHAGIFTNGATERGLLDQADVIVLIGVDPVEPIPKPWTYAAPVLSLAEVPTGEPYFPIAHELVRPIADSIELLDTPHEWSKHAGADYQADVRHRLLENAPGFGPVEVVQAVARQLPNATATVDAGAHFLAVMPFWPTAAPRELLISNGLATMGYAVPAAIGAALNSGRHVVAFVGDGGLSMTMAELETIVRLDLNITCVVFNDSALSLIEIKQQDGHGGVGAVRYLPTDFAAIAQAQGMNATIANSTRELTEALHEADSDGPFLVDARIDPSHYPHLIEVTRG